MSAIEERELSEGFDILEERMTCLEAAMDEIAELIRERFAHEEVEDKIRTDAA